MIPIPERVRKNCRLSADGRFVPLLVKFVDAQTPDWEAYSKDRWVSLGLGEKCAICGEALGKARFVLVRREFVKVEMVFLEPPSHLECLCWAYQEQLLYPHRLSVKTPPDEERKWRAVGLHSPVLLSSVSKVIIKKLKDSESSYYSGRLGPTTPCPEELSEVEGMYNYVRLHVNIKEDEPPKDSTPMTVFRRAYKVYLTLPEPVKKRLGELNHEPFGLTEAQAEGIKVDEQRQHAKKNQDTDGKVQEPGGGDS